MIMRVRYQVATYSGIVRVVVPDDSANEYGSDRIKALAEASLRRQAGELPFGYRSFRVLSDGELDREPDAEKDGEA